MDGIDDEQQKHLCVNEDEKPRKFERNRERKNWFHNWILNNEVFELAKRRAEKVVRNQWLGLIKAKRSTTSKGASPFVKVRASGRRQDVDIGNEQLLQDAFRMHLLINDNDIVQEAFSPKRQGTDCMSATIKKRWKW